MSSQLHLLRSLVVSLCLFGTGALARAAQAGPTKEWKGEVGNANQNDKWLDGVKPGNSDIAKVASGQMTVNVPLTFGLLEFSGGLIDGTNTLTLSLAGSTWTGGAIQGAKVSFSGASISSGAAKSVKGGEVTFGGSTSWTGAAGETISTGGGAALINTGVFATNFDGRLAFDQTGDRAVFSNRGTFLKSGGLNQTTIETVFNQDSAGTVEVATGTLVLAGGGSSSGALALASGATLQISGRDYAFSGSALNGAGTIELASGTTTFTDTAGSASLKINGGTAKVSGSHTTSGALHLLGGALAGSGTDGVTASGGFNWNGGDINRTSVSSSGAATIGAGGQKRLLDGAQLNLSGTTTWTADDIVTTGGATLIRNSGSFVATSGASITNADQTGSRATFRNDGTFTNGNASGTAPTQIYTRFDNSAGATINVTSGTLSLLGGGTSSGDVTLSAGTNIVLASTDYQFTGGALTGGGSIEVESATTTFSGTSGTAGLNVKGGTVRFDGTHTTSGSLRLESGMVGGNSTAAVGAFEWSGGHIVAATINASNSVIGGNVAKQISDGAQLNLSGNTTWSADNIAASGNTTTISNSGAFSIVGDGIIASSETTGNRATFRNDGTLTKANTRSPGTTEVQVNFVNSGSGVVTIEAGRLKLSGGGNSNGTITIGSAAAIDVTGNNFVFGGGVLAGDGVIDVAEAKASFAGTTGSASLRVGGGGTVAFDGAHQTTGKLIIGGGAVTGAGNATVGSLEWTEGTLATKLTTTGATFATGGKLLAAGAELTLAGESTWDGSSLGTSGDAKIKNQSGAIFRTTADGALGSDGSATFTNLGTFEKTAGTSTGTTEFQTKFENAGTLKASAGTVKLSGGGSSVGTVTIASGAKLQIAGNDFEFTGGALNGGGRLELTEKTTTFSNATSSDTEIALTGSTAMAKFDGTHVGTGKLSLASGTVLGGGTAEFGALDWSGGALNGRVKTTGATTITGTTTKLLGGELTLAGNTTWDGGAIATSGAATIRNERGAQFLASADGVLANTGSTIFTNNGSFTKRGGTGGTTDIQSRFDNNGAVQVENGILRLAGGGRNAGEASILIASAATLEIASDLELAANSSLSGAGTGRLVAGTLTANGSIGVARFTFDGGTLSGSQSFAGVVDWNSGNWNAAEAGATTTIGHGGVLNFNGGSSLSFNNRSIFNDGIVNWNTGNLQAGAGSAFTNNAVFNDLNGGDKRLAATSGTGGSAGFTNNGEYRKTQGGTTTVDVPFTNNGGLSIAGGSIVFTNAFTNHGRIDLTNGAVAHFATPLTFGANSPLTGVGTINAPFVTAAGLVSPGHSPGALTITGNLTLLTTSTLLIELGGPRQGVDYDFLSVGGAGVLGGNLSVSFLNGYQWTLPADATFTVLTANNGLTGVFANAANGQRLFTADGGASFQVNYGLGSAFAPSSLVLSSFMVAVPEPSTYAMIAIGGLVVLVSLRRRKN